jgi:hypothetical protein
LSGKESKSFVEMLGFMMPTSRLYRPESQMAGFQARYGMSVTLSILDRTVNRGAALLIEKSLAKKHVDVWNTMPREQSRPGSGPF